MCIRDRLNETLDSGFTQPVSYTHLDVYKRQAYYNMMQPVRHFTKNKNDFCLQRTHILLLLSVLGTL